ncbi:MAG: AAA family ATPase [Candidatus Micrarchaeaceae archaeon]
MKAVIVTGSPGAGKTTLLGMLHLRGTDIVNVGSIMKDIALEKGYVNDRDEIRKLGLGKIDYLREAAFNKISNMSGNIVIDTHATVESEGKFVTGLPMRILGKADWLRAFVYIDAKSQDILLRRALDTKRHREREGKDALDLQRSINLSTLAFYSSYLNISLYVIKNEQGMLEQSAAALKKAILESLGD